MGKRNNLTFEQVISIRKNNRNPEVTFGHPDVHYRNLEKKSYMEMVEIFNRTMTAWRFSAVETLCDERNKEPGYVFVIMILDCIIIDLLSQYRYGIPVSDGEKFKDFFREYLGKYNEIFDKPIRSCSCRWGQWKEETIADVADALWHCFRCGIVHSGRILEYGRINFGTDSAIKIIYWGDDRTKKEISINPQLLLVELRKAFEKYTNELKSGDNELKNNFIKKFEIDYGYKLRDKQNE